MKAPFFVFTIVLIVALISCNSSPNETMGSVGSDESAAPPASMELNIEAKDLAEGAGSVREESTVVINPNPGTAGPKKIIKDGHLTVKSADIFESKKAIDEVLKGLKAYVTTQPLDFLYTLN